MKELTNKTLKNQTLKGGRNSNLELLRILAMLAIIAHHYVVSSDVQNLALETFNVNSVLTLIFGGGGKTAINCFVLITGYFMCKSNITAKKFVKLVAEMMFYGIVVYVIFVATGYEAFSFSGLLDAIIPVSTEEVASNFKTCFLYFYLLIPFLSKFVNALNKKEHLILICILLFVFTVLPSVGIEVSSNYVIWFSILFIIASFVRLHPMAIFENTKFWAMATVVSLLLSWASVAVILYCRTNLGMTNVYHFVADCNKILAVATGVSVFMFFKNVKIPNSKFINTVAASTFGVLLIHANSDTMKVFLWGDFLKNTEFFGTQWQWPHMILSVLGVFVVCTAIDYVRIKLLEKPFLRLYDKAENKIRNKIKQKKLEKKID